jgi:hypothetical protein
MKPRIPVVICAALGICRGDPRKPSRPSTAGSTRTARSSSPTRPPAERGDERHLEDRWVRAAGPTKGQLPFATQIAARRNP